MSDLKTKPTDASVESYVAEVSDPARRQDCRALVEMMRKVTGSDARLWGTGLIGFGQYHYKYESGREGDWPLAGQPQKCRSESARASPVVVRSQHGLVRQHQRLLQVRRLIKLELAHFLLEKSHLVASSDLWRWFLLSLSEQDHRQHKWNWGGYHDHFQLLTGNIEEHYT